VSRGSKNSLSTLPAEQKKVIFNVNITKDYGVRNYGGEHIKRVRKVTFILWNVKNCVLFCGVDPISIFKIEAVWRYVQGCQQRESGRGIGQFVFVLPNLADLCEPTTGLFYPNSKLYLHWHTFVHAQPPSFSPSSCSKLTYRHIHIQRWKSQRIKIHRIGYRFFIDF
jgi:hypothetical protein